MIVDNVPRLKRMVAEVWKPLTGLFVWDCLVTITFYVFPFRAPELPLALFGTAIAVFLTARGNAAYQRWWEGRTLWGALINASRSFARQAIVLFPGDAALDLRRTLVLRQIAYAQALRCQLRRHPIDTEVLRFLSEGEAQPSLARTNPANGLLDGSARRIAEAQRAGLIDSIQQARLEATLVDLSNAQGGMERLKNTPLPLQYRFFPELFARVFCVLLPIGLVESLGWATPVGSTIAGLMFLAVLAIGDDLVDPFADTVHDIPLSAMCRTIEIDLLQAIGDAAPEPLKPVKGVLW